MAEPKWTPGPWHVGRTLTRLSDLGPIETFVVVDDTLDWLCRIDKNGSANARLIAAAPELAAFVERVRATIDESDYHEGDGDVRSLIEEAEALLAKARGD